MFNFFFLFKQAKMSMKYFEKKLVQNNILAKIAIKKCLWKWTLITAF